MRSWAVTWVADRNLLFVKLERRTILVFTNLSVKWSIFFSYEGGSRRLSVETTDVCVSCPSQHRVLVCLCLPLDLVRKKKHQTLVPYAFITLIFWYFRYVCSLIYFILYLQNIILRTGVVFHTVEEWFISRLVKELLSGGVIQYTPRVL